MKPCSTFDRSKVANSSGGVFNTAISTATPVEDLLAEADLVASAFSHLTDETDKQAKSQELLHRVGQITTVTQRDTAVETENLIALMKLAGIEVENLGGTIGQITAAGNNSSTAIAAILDALTVSIPGANLAGVSIEQLIALTGLFRLETQRAGSSIGSTFATLFQTMTNAEAQANIQDLTNGIVNLRDSSGNLRPVVEIMLEINSLFKEGVIDAGRMQDIFKAMSPPLNPAAAKDVALIFGMLDRLPEALREVETTGAGALDGLVDKLNAALGPQFRILIEEIKSGFSDLFSDDIVNGGQSFIDLMRQIGAFLQSLPPDALRGAAGILAIAAAFGTAHFVGARLFSLLGLRGLTGAFQGAGAAASAAGLGTGVFAGAVAGATVLLSRFLPVLAAYAAIDLAGQVGAQTDALKSQVGGLAVGLDRAGLQALRGRLTSQLTPGSEGSTSTRDARLEDAIGAFTTDPALRDSIAEVDRLLAELDERGGDAKVSLEDLGAGFSGAADASTEFEEAVARQAEEMERLIAQYTGTAEASAGMTEAQRIELEAAQLLEATRKGQADDLEKLGERYREGKISAEEFAQGQQIVSQAAELAAQLVATAGDRLAEYPIFAAAAAEGNEALTAKVYEMIVASGGSINAIAGLI